MINKEISKKEGCNTESFHYFTVLVNNEISINTIAYTCYDAAAGNKNQPFVGCNKPIKVAKL